MARIRTLKPELWMSPQVMNLAHSSRLMFLGLITQADDEGRGLADPRRLKAAVFPGDDCTIVDVDGWLCSVAAEHLCVLYSDSKGVRLYELTGWRAHQRIQKPQKSNYESSNGTVPEESVTTTGGSDRKGSEGNGSEGSGRAQARSRTSRVPAEFSPDLQYATAELPDVDAEREAQKFRDWEFKTPRSDWPAVWRNWVQRCKETGQYARLTVNGKPVKHEATPAEIAAARRRAEDDNRRVATRLGLENFGKVQ